MAEVYADENVPLELAHALRRQGHQVRTTKEERQANRGVRDDSVLRYAHERGWVVVTGDRRHFIRLHMRSKQHSGIVVYSDHDDLEVLAVRIHAALRDHPPFAGKLIRVNHPPVGTQVEP